MIIKTPLRLDIAGSHTDLPGYREKVGAHINVPLGYYIYITEDNCSLHSTINLDSTSDTEFTKDINFRIAALLKVPLQDLTAYGNIEHGSGLGASSATAVGIVKWYAEQDILSLAPSAQAAIAITALQQTGVVGRQDEYAAAFGKPLYLRYRNSVTVVDPFELPAQFREQIENWRLLYTPRTMSCQEILTYEMNANLPTEEIVYFANLMYNAILKNDWDEFYKWYMAHWQFVETISPYKINDTIRDFRQKYDGIYIRPCGAGAGGYLLVHGEIAGENIHKVRLK